MWGFHPVADVHSALSLERRRYKWCLIPLGDSPKIISPHTIYGFSLKEHLWSQPITSHTVHVGFWALEIDSDPHASSKKKAPWPPEGTCLKDFLEWWIQVLSTVLHQQEKGEYEGEIMTWSAPSTLSTLVNVMDLDSIGGDLGFICLQFFPVAAEVCSPRSLF